MADFADRLAAVEETIREQHRTYHVAIFHGTDPEDIENDYDQWIACYEDFEIRIESMQHGLAVAPTEDGDSAVIFSVVILYSIAGGTG